MKKIMSTFIALVSLFAVSWMVDAPPIIQLSDAGYDSLNDQTYFVYHLTTGTKGLSHLTFELNSCSEDVASVLNWNNWEIVYQDPSTGLTGLKLEDLDMDQGETVDFTLFMDGFYIAELITTGMKTGQVIVYQEVGGPSCTPTNVAISQMQATQNDTTNTLLAVIGLLLAIATIVILQLDLRRLE